MHSRVNRIRASRSLSSSARFQNNSYIASNPLAGEVTVTPPHSTDTRYIPPPSLCSVIILASQQCSQVPLSYHQNLLRASPWVETLRLAPLRQCGTPSARSLHTRPSPA